MNRSPRIPIVILATLAPCLFLGCAVDQLREVALYRQVLDADTPPPSARLAPGQPLTLDLALSLANADNERLGIEGENYVQAIIAKKRAAADFFPTIAFTPEFFKAKPVAGYPKRQLEFLDAPVQGGYVDFDAIRSIADFKRAAATIEQRKALLLDAQASLLIDVARAYYQVLVSERQAAVLENSAELQEERVRDVEAQIKAGTGRPLDLAQAQAQASATRVQLIQARGDVRNARTLLAFLIGAPDVTGPVADDFQPPADPGSLEQYLALADRRRQDLQAAHVAVEAALRGVESAFAQYYPSLTINIQYFAYKESLPPASIYAALFQLNLPLFTGGRIHADVRAAWSFFRQAGLSESLLRRRIAQDVAVAWQDLATSRDRLRELGVNVRAAQEAFEQAADLVKFGRATNLERLVAQDQLLTAQLGQASESFTQKLAYLTLRRAAGLLTLGPQAQAPATQPAATQPR